MTLFHVGFIFTCIAVLTERMKYLIAVIFITAHHFFVSFGIDPDTEPPCATPQYLTLGRPGRIDCDFGETFYGAFWYNSSNYEATHPVLYYKERTASGVGFNSGEFNISTNGSLIINEVSLSHDHKFTVVVFQTKLGTETIPNFVRVVVTVTPSQRHPMITSCSSKRFCFKELDQQTELSCYIQGSRPPVNLTLSRITSNGTVPLETTNTNTQHITLYTSTSSVRLSDPQTNYFQALSCEASEPPKLLSSNYSVILLQNGPFDVDPTKAAQLYGEQHKSLELSCSSFPTTYLVCKKRMSDGSFVNVAKAVFYQNEFTDVLLSKYSVNKAHNSLVVHDIDLEDESIYICICGNGFTENINMFDVRVYVPPSPPYLDVDGCNPHQRCTLTSQATSVKLKCSIKGIRPPVVLHWRFVDKRLSGFEEIKSDTHISHDGGVYDITITSEYSFELVDQNIVTFECAVRTNQSVPVDWSYQVDVLIPKTEESTTKSVYETKAKPRSKILIIVILVPLLAILLVIIGVFLHPSIRSKCRAGCLERGSADRNAQNAPRHGEDVSLLVLPKNDFTNQLVTHYREACEAIKRLPQDITVKIDEIFVEGGLEVLNTAMQGNWGKNASYHHILDGHERVILEGGTGYGKSIICLKMAYDWYTRNQSSPLKNVDIFILLHMRYLQKDTSLYEAIKQYLLPKDSNISTNDIEDMLTTSQSAVIVLDGFNRFPHKRDYKDTAFKEIMMKQVLQNCTVLLTTTPEVLPNPLPKLITRVRLVGFDENTQNKYISEVLTQGNASETKRITNIFNSIPGIFAFCQIPLFFTLLAHLAHERKLSNELSADTVTDCFKSIIDALTKAEQHHGKTYTEKNDNKRKLQEQNLYKEAFKALCETNKGLIWEKTILKNLVGSKIYEEYTRIGVLVEEEIFEAISDKNSSDIQMKYITKVSFYHNVFCEWFAAQYLADSNVWSEPETLTNSLQNIHPIDHQYVFRFACGLNNETAEQIIKHMKNIEDGEAFATMCILEQRGGIAGIKDVVRDICSTPVTISKKHSRLLQRSHTQVLVLASDNKIPIEIVWLDNTNAYFNQAKESLTFTTGIQLPKLETMDLLSIIETGKEYSLQQFTGVLEYAKVCTGLKALRFRGCLLPFSVKPNILGLLYKRSVSVEWMLPITDKTLYVLNLNRGTWEVNGDELPNKLYKTMKRAMLENKIT